MKWEKWTCSSLRWCVKTLASIKIWAKEQKGLARTSPKCQVGLVELSCYARVQERTILALFDQHNSILVPFWFFKNLLFSVSQPTFAPVLIEHSGYITEYVFTHQLSVRTEEPIVFQFQLRTSLLGSRTYFCWLKWAQPVPSSTLISEPVTVMETLPHNLQDIKDLLWVNGDALPLAVRVWDNVLVLCCWDVGLHMYWTSHVSEEACTGPHPSSVVGPVQFQGKAKSKWLGKLIWLSYNKIPCFGTKGEPTQ